MPAGCQFTFSYSASIRRLPTWEEAESCNGNMMLLSASFSSFCPLRMSHPYLLMSGSLARGLVSALCRLLHDMRHSARTTTTSQRKLLPLRQTRDERSAHDFEKIVSGVKLSYIGSRQLERAERRRFFFQSRIGASEDLFTGNSFLTFSAFNKNEIWYKKLQESMNQSCWTQTFFVKQLSTGHKLTFPGIHSCVKYLSEGL